MATYFNCFLLTATFDKGNCHLSGPQLPVFSATDEKGKKGHEIWFLQRGEGVISRCHGSKVFGWQQTDKAT